VQLVVADTGPINYLILIGHIDVLARLFEKVIVPSVVAAELASSRAPQPVQDWIAEPPAWLDVYDCPAGVETDASLDMIDRGERAAILLALSTRAELLLMDDRAGVKVARSNGIRVTGTLGLLDLAAEAGLVDFEQAAQLLRHTTVS
jgi:predicted nucleic acid-binding protein